MRKVIDRERNYEVAQVLGRRMEVDTDCRLHIFWGRDGDEVEHVFDDVVTAMCQDKHVLESYLGLREQIRRNLLIIPGESQKIDALVRGAMDLAKELFEPEALTVAQHQRIKGRLGRLIAEIGAVRNAYKVKFKAQLREARKALDAGDVGKAKKLGAAADLYKGAEAGLARLEDIAKKVRGVGIRLEILLREEERVRRTIHATYTSLQRLLVKKLPEGGNLSQKDLLRIASQICGGKSNLVNGLESIWIPPYGQRVRSREVRRLWKVEEYAAAGDTERMRNAVKGAFLKLRPVIKEMEDRRKTKAKRWLQR